MTHPALPIADDSFYRPNGRTGLRQLRRISQVGFLLLWAALFLLCRAQVLAMSTGREIALLSDEMVAQVQAPPEQDRHTRQERVELFFDAMKRVLDRELPGYAD